MRKFFLFVGSVARGDPPLAAIGVVLTDSKGQILEKVGQGIGRATPEIAEYRAVLTGLQLALRHEPGELVLFTADQKLMNQLCGSLYPRDPAVQHLNKLAQELLGRFSRVRVSYVDHEVSRSARRLAEQVLYEERRAQREREFLRREIYALVEGLSLEELRRIHSFLRSLRAEKSDAHRHPAGT